MKKMALIAVVMAFLFTVSALAESTLELKLGFSFSGRVRSDSQTSNQKSAFLLGGEFNHEYNENVTLGIGVEHLFKSDLKNTVNFDTNARKVGFTNIYGLLKLVHPADEISPYLALRLGYGMPTGGIRTNAQTGVGDLDGGLYWGIGGGVLFQENITAEITFSENRTKWSNSGSNPGSITYKVRRVAATLGYRFRLE